MYWVHMITVSDIGWTTFGVATTGIRDSRRCARIYRRCIGAIKLIQKGISSGYELVVTCVSMRANGEKCKYKLQSPRVSC